MRVRSLCLLLVVSLLLGIVSMAPVARAASDLKASDECLAIIKKFEGFSARPYVDSDGKYTIGYGTRCPDELVSKYTNEPMTKEEADAELRKEMVTYEKAVNAFIDRHALTYTQGQFDGVVSLVFNCGTSWLYKPGTLRTAVIEGGTALSGAPVQAVDLRAGVAMIIAGLIASGETEVTNIHLIERGYDDIVEKLQALGAAISYKPFPTEECD